jgi:hypothetical protein
MAVSAYEIISATTLGSAVQTVTLSSIPATYTDLVVVVNAQASAQSDLYLSFNGDSSFLYSRTALYGDGTSAGSNRFTRADSLGFIPITYYGAVTTTAGASVHTINIMNYANTTTHKTVLSRCNAASSGVDASVGLWGSTAAITSMTFDLPTTRTFSTGSTFTLYGVKAA